MAKEKEKKVNENGANNGENNAEKPKRNLKALFIKIGTAVGAIVIGLLGILFGIQVGKRTELGEQQEVPEAPSTEPPSEVPNSQE